MVARPRNHFYPRGFAPRTPLHALSLAASPARSESRRRGCNPHVQLHGRGESDRPFGPTDLPSHHPPRTTRTTAM